MLNISTLTVKQHRFGSIFGVRRINLHLKFVFLKKDVEK